ncbi:MAG: UDP-2,3-diacylglucosamine diphosphatase [candidate division Zixibacteria bacterium]|nr:UDP-2,3-diacylglucosamine diphosphatase [candidate division Zixibacteria bacterium]
MAVYLISDSHFGAPWSQNEPHGLRLFSDFINSIKSDAEYLYIIGDLFDFWFEYHDGFPNRYPDITGKLKELSSSGTKVILIGGNHDWWAGRTFIQLTDAVVEKGDLKITHHGKKIFIGHGDGIAKADWGYRLMRKILRNRLNIWLFSKLSYSLGLKLAKLVSSGSRAVGENRQWKFLEDYEEYAQKLINRGFHAVFIGHTHIPQYKKLENGIYINTGDWINNYTYAVLNEDSIRLMTFANGIQEDFDPSKLSPPEKFNK